MMSNLSVSSGHQFFIPPASENDGSVREAATNPAISVGGIPLKLTPQGEGVIAAKQKYSGALARNASKPATVSQVSINVGTEVGAVERAVISNEASEAALSARDTATLLTKASTLAVHLQSSTHKTEADSLLSNAQDSAALTKKIAELTPFSPNKEVAAFLKKYGAAVKDEALSATNRLSSMKESFISRRSLPARDASASSRVDVLLNSPEAKTFLEARAFFDGKGQASSFAAVADDMRVAISKPDDTAPSQGGTNSEGEMTPRSLSRSGSTASLSEVENEELPSDDDWEKEDPTGIWKNISDEEATARLKQPETSSPGIN